MSLLQYNSYVLVSFLFFIFFFFFQFNSRDSMFYSL